jgi:hypothetical protein
VAGLPGANEQADLEPGLAHRPTARAHDAARVGADLLCEAALLRQCAHQLPEQVLVAEFESERHLTVIVDRGTPVLPPETADSCPTSG